MKAINGDKSRAGVVLPWLGAALAAVFWLNLSTGSVDSTTGELRLGPAIRQRDGTIKLYGAIPSRGANIIFARYRYGGGQAL